MIYVLQIFNWHMGVSGFPWTVPLAPPEINILIKFAIQFPWPDSEPLSVGENDPENEPRNNMK